MRGTITGIGRILVLTIGLLVIGVGATVMAQGQNPFGQILTALEQLQQSVDALGASSNVAVTPVLRFQDDLVACRMVNVAGTNRDVTAQLMDATGQIINEITRTLTPGLTGGFVAVHSGTAYCTFTVLDGTKADIRGSLALDEREGGSLVSVTAE